MERSLAQAARHRAQPARQLGATPEEKAVLDGVAAFAKAYEAGNAAAIAEMFLDESMIVDPEGNAIRGKAAVAAMYDAAFKENPGLKLEPTVEDIRFVTPDLARVEGKTQAFDQQGRRIGIHRLQHAAGSSRREMAHCRDARVRRTRGRCHAVRTAQGARVDGRRLGRRRRQGQVAVERPLGRQPELPGPDVFDRASGREAFERDDVHRLGPAIRPDQVMVVQLGRGAR